MAPPARPKHRQRRVPRRVSLAGVRVLVVDALALDRKLLRVLLTTEGCVVETTSHTDAAWAVLASLRPHIVVLDQRIPSDNALAMVPALKSIPATRKVIVVVVSAYDGGEGDAY